MTGGIFLKEKQYPCFKTIYIPKMISKLLATTISTKFLC